MPGVSNREVGFRWHTIDGKNGEVAMRFIGTLRLAISILLAAAWLTACSAPPPPAPGARTEPAAGGQASGTPIKIGYMADANGTSAPIAAGMHLGTDLAVQQINAAGGINGHLLQVTYVDPQSDPTQASQMATQLIQTDKV